MHPKCWTPELHCSIVKTAKLHTPFLSNIQTEHQPINWWRMGMKSRAVSPSTSLASKVPSPKGEKLMCSTKTIQPRATCWRMCSLKWTWTDPDDPSLPPVLELHCRFATHKHSSYLIEKAQWSIPCPKTCSPGSLGSLGSIGSLASLFFFFFQNWTRRNFPRGVPGAVLLQRARPREVDPLPRNDAQAAGVPWQGLGQRQGISFSQLDQFQAECDI